jgi:hypothetical protein
VQRRVSLPGADELFRPTQDDDGSASASPRPTAVPDPVSDTGRSTGLDPDESTATVTTGHDTGGGSDLERRSSGRVRHDEKMTVYVTSDELLDLEHARLALRRDHGVAVDRGRLVREAVSIVLADLADRGDGADLVRRLAPS